MTGTTHRNVIATTGETKITRTYVCHLPLVDLLHLVGTDTHMMGRRDSPPRRRHDSPPHRSRMNEPVNGKVEGRVLTGASSAIGQ
ncbi:hypothetical protein M404DRAFT_1005251 [Pisolithus tinctorius Marx 270]|uniref:Uncharacterized protein n=1 Tax=Pisolithus tinctorius Marx 270 TaxID=870435 RepID=A0A0C3JLX7_PISTI|nr:hypothetical protein M404DRAFT_1005251 [Pisolithus tinctorius Marx 270]